MKELWQTQMPVQVEAVAWDLLVQSLEHYRQEEKADDCGWEVPDFLVVVLNSVNRRLETKSKKM